MDIDPLFGLPAHPLIEEHAEQGETVLVGAPLIVGIGATYTVIDVGHSGAKSVWNDVGD